jgi:hypothetical protein
LGGGRFWEVITWNLRDLRAPSLGSAEYGGRPNRAKTAGRLQASVAVAGLRGAAWRIGLKRIYTADKVSKSW